MLCCCTRCLVHFLQSFLSSRLLSSFSCTKFQPQRLSGQAVVTGGCHPFSPPTTYLHLYFAKGSTLPLLVGLRRTLPTRPLAPLARNNHFLSSNASRNSLCLLHTGIRYQSSSYTTRLPLAIDRRRFGEGQSTDGCIAGQKKG